jgi:hypothetical protein
MNNKSYNNPEDWDKIEGKSKPIIINSEDNNGEIIESEEIAGDEDDEVLNAKDIEENFDEVLKLTEYNDSMLQPSTFSGVVAEYTDINAIEINKKHEQDAKKFVSKITKFILDFKDIELDEAHKNYLRQVGNLQVQHLADLLYLTDVNKQMLNNILARVNATQAEDYSIISAYNNLANQHLKLIKELQNTYKSIPSVIKKMRTEVMCNQDINSQENTEEEVITKEFGETQFTNSKQLLRKIIEDRENKKIS